MLRSVAAKNRTMKTSTTTIAGKEVTLAYCYGTEIAYKDFTNEDINDFMPEVAEALNSNRMPDIKKTVYLILSAMTAFYRDKHSPIVDSDILDEATPEELGKAIGTVLVLRAKFYNIPTGEPEDKATEDTEGAKKN